MPTDITTRLEALIKEKTSDRRRAMELQELTRIPTSNWKNVISGKQRPTCHMIEAVSRQWPDYAYWLATGTTEPESGHIAPKSESGYPVVNGSPQEWATKEREHIQKLIAQVPDDDAEQTKWIKQIKDEVFQIKEGFIAPAVPLNFQRIMKALEQEPSDDLFLLELDEELRKIRMKRWEVESKLRSTIYDERRFMGQGLVAEKIADKIRKLFNKIFNR